MKAVLRITLPAAAAALLLLLPSPLRAQGCADDQAMVQDSRKTLTDLVDTVKKESLQDFENKYHQKTAVSNLTFFSSLAGELVTCLEKAGEDPAATAEQKASYKTQHDAAVKLKGEADRGRDELKSAASPKDAKTVVEKMNLAD